MRQSLLSGLLAIALLPALHSAHVHAQSFNCRYAKTADEVLICQDDQLSALDERMASIYSQVHQSLYGSQRLMLEAEQGTWLCSRMGCGRDRDCIAQAYQRRIQELTPSSCTVADPTGTPLNVRATPAGRLLPPVLYNGANVVTYQTDTDARGKAWALVGRPGGGVYGWVFREYIICGGRESAQEANTSPPPPPPSPEQTSKSNAPSSGTGFFVSNDGYLITNEHAVDSCKTLRVVDPAGESILARVVRTSKSDDLALLKTNAVPRTIAVFRESGGISQGGTVVTYGFPLTGLLASTGNVSTGLVTALSGIDDNPRQMQISAPVQPGNSGSPLVDMKGAVVGVIVSKLNAVAVARITADIPQNINFAIKASAVIDLLDANSVKYHSESLQRELSIEALTKQMKEYTVKNRVQLVVCRPTDLRRPHTIALYHRGQ